MPAPPPESDPAMVTAIAVMRCVLVTLMAAGADGGRHRRIFFARRIDDGAQLARGGHRIGRERQRRDHRDAVGARRDHLRGVRRRDAGDAAHREIADAVAKHPHDAREPVGPDRAAGIVLRGRAEHAADADIIENAERRRLRLLDRLDRQPDERHRPENGRAPPRRSCPPARDARRRRRPRARRRPGR